MRVPKRCWHLWSVSFGTCRNRGWELCTVTDSCWCNKPDFCHANTKLAFHTLGNRQAASFRHVSRIRSSGTLEQCRSVGDVAFTHMRRLTRLGIFRSRRAKARRDARAGVGGDPRAARVADGRVSCYHTHAHTHTHTHTYIRTSCR